MRREMRSEPSAPPSSLSALRSTVSTLEARWSRLADTGPEPRAMGFLAYDKARDRVVLFGGRKGWPDDLADTWEWDGSTWRRVTP